VVDPWTGLSSRLLNLPMNAHYCIKRSQVTTVTVTQYVVNNAQTTVVVGGGAVLSPSTSTIQQFNGYCSTLIVQNQDGLPTTRAGSCGTILVVGDAPRSAVGRDLLIALGVLYGSLGLIWGLFGRGRW